MNKSIDQGNTLKVSKLTTAINNSLYWGKRIVLGFTLIAMVTTQAGAESFIKKTMDDFLSQNTMTNVTSAKAFKTATRGVVSGGSIQARNKIFNNKMINFIPPSFNASCNGIDMFLGSFSFINKDEIVQLFRSIASNALGFLFQLALEVVSPQIAQLMQKFSDIVREINNLVSDSCRMAQGIVTTGLDTVKSFWNQSESNAAATATNKGYDDWFGNYFGGTSGSTAISSRSKQSQYYRTEAKDNGEIGNFMWNAMKRNISRGVNRSLASRLVNIGVEHMEETIMSLTGYFIASETKTGATAGAHDSTVDEFEVQETGPAILKLRALVEGGQTQEFKIYSCNADDDCMNPTPPTSSDTDAKGIAQLMYKSLCGTYDITADCQADSAISKLADNNHGAGGDLTEAEKAAIFTLPPNYRSLITDLQILSSGATKADKTFTSGGKLIKSHIRFLALDAINRMVTEMLNELKIQINGYKGPSKDILLKQVKEAEENFRAQISDTKISTEYGNINSVMADLNHEVEIYKSIPNASVIQDSKVSGNSKD